MTQRRWLPTILKFAVSIVLVGALLNAVGAQDALGRIAGAHLGWLALAVFVGLVQLPICAARWQTVLLAVGAQVSYKVTFVYLYIGAFFNQTLPSAVGGDVVRGYMAYKDGVGFPVVLSSLILERVVTVLALLALVAGLSPFATGLLQGAGWYQGVAWLALAAGVAGTALLMVLDRVPERYTRFRVVRGLVVLAGDTRTTLLKAANAAPAMFWSLLGHVNLSVVVYVLARALDIDVELMTCMVLFPPVLLAQIVPISLAGWGVREGAMVALFSLAGIPAGEALALSILYGILFAVTSMPGAALWLASGRRSLKEAEAFAERAEAQ